MTHQYKLGYNNSLVYTNKIYFTYFIAHHRLTTIYNQIKSFHIYSYTQTQPKKLYVYIILLVLMRSIRFFMFHTNPSYSSIQFKETDKFLQGCGEVLKSLT